MNKKLAIVLALAVVGTFAAVALFDTEASETELIFGFFRGRQEKNLTNVFTSWKAKHNKTYSGAEHKRRYAIFVKNLKRIEKINSVKRNYTVGLNQFADLTKTEFASLYLGYKKPATRKPSVSRVAVTVPASIDWRDKNAVTAIKNQGQCGSCWAFSTTGALEGLNAINNGNLLSFSEEQLVDCSGSYGNEGCNGGAMDNAFQYVAAEGIELESDYPYTASGGTSGSCAYSSSKVAFKNGGYEDVETYSDSALQAAVAQQPVSVAIEADQDCFQYYTGGVLDDSSCGTSLDHGVLAVGYSTGSSDGNYWIVKNSWGTSWGLNGYVQIAMNGGSDGGICGINLDPSYPTA